MVGRELFLCVWVGDGAFAATAAVEVELTPPRWLLLAAAEERPSTAARNFATQVSPLASGAQGLQYMNTREPTTATTMSATRVDMVAESISAYCA